MRAYWSDTRPNGQPVETGTVCFVTDLEDGSLPIPTYGKTQEEVLQKLALQNAHAQLEIARRSSLRPAAQPAPAATPEPPKRISPDQVMQATADLRDPAKAGQAISTLLESATGISPERLVLQNFGTVAAAWEHKNPDFFPHNGNRRLVAQVAAQLAGGLGHVTEEHLDSAFAVLRSTDDLFEAPDNNHQPSPAFPDESQVQRSSERPRTRFATGSRSTTFRPQMPTRTYKYTEEELRTMPISKSRRLIETNDKDYADAMEHYFGGSSTAQATA